MPGLFKSCLVITNKTFQFFIILIGLPLLSNGQGCNCPAANSCGACAGGLTSLTLRFNGSLPGAVTASDNDGVVYTGTVNPAETFTFNGSIPNTKFTGADVFLTVGGLLNATIGSNCSSQSFVSETFGAFTIVAGLSHDGGAICCSASAIETIPPVISSCPTNVIVSLSTTGCTAVANWIPPSASDNCTVSSFTSTYNPGDVFVPGVTQVTYTAVDAYNNTSTCSFDVVASDNTIPVVTGCPADITVTANANCQAIVSWTPPKATDNCSVTLTPDSSPGDTFPVGSTLVTYTAVDASNNAATCTFNVVVQDKTIPVISGCPVDITVTANASCNAIVNWTAPTAADDCAVTLAADYSPGDTFSTGISTVTYKAQDASGNIALCQFKIAVQNGSAPVITGCPDDITITANDSGEANPSWVEPSASVQCGNVIIEKSHMPGSLFPIGSTQVTYKAIDDAGASTSCLFNVIVEEAEIVVDISKVVTPDGNGINDTWIMTNIEKFSDNIVVIVDRWGGEVYKASGYNNANVVWDGTNRNGVIVPTGTYFYTLEMSFGRRRVKQKGFIEVIQ